MKQYCRYCAHLIVGDANYCELKRLTMTDAAAKHTNNCPMFDFLSTDAFDENRVYVPRRRVEHLQQLKMEVKQHEI